MKTEVVSWKPKFGSPLGNPDWWHHHGTKMRVEHYNQTKDHEVLTLSGSAAKITIRKALYVYPDMRTSGWLIDWEVLNSAPTELGTHGRTQFSDDELKAAFGLSKSSGEYGDWLIERFGGDSAEQKKYIRWGNFLNIPCPGTGHDGDPNVSIWIRDEIQEAVRRLLN